MSSRGARTWRPAVSLQPASGANFQRFRHSLIISANATLSLAIRWTVWSGPPLIINEGARRRSAMPGAATIGGPCPGRAKGCKGSRDSGHPALRIKSKRDKIRFVPVHPMALRLIGEYLEAGKHGGAVSHESMDSPSSGPWRTTARERSTSTSIRDLSIATS